MQTNIMGGPSIAAIDVRDMLCAQALALVSGAMGKLAPGSVLEVFFNAPDVKSDLLVWAREKGYAVTETQNSTIRLIR